MPRARILLSDREGLDALLLDREKIARGRKLATSCSNRNSRSLPCVKQTLPPVSTISPESDIDDGIAGVGTATATDDVESVLILITLYFFLGFITCRKLASTNEPNPLRTEYPELSNLDTQIPLTRLNDNQYVG